VWNPPIIFPLVAPLSFMPFHMAVVLWLMLMCAATAASIRMLLALPELKTQRPLFFAGQLFFLFSFYPVALALAYGQSSPLLLFGLVVGIWFLARTPRSFWNEIGGGLALSLTVLKPHLLYLVYLWLLARALKQASWNIVGGMI